MLCMERTVWTDERLDDGFARIDERFDQVDRRLDRIESELGTLRRDVHVGFMVQTTALLGLAGVILARPL
jgi:hypothetical protein